MSDDKLIQPLPWRPERDYEGLFKVMDSNGIAVFGGVTKDEAEFIVNAANNYTDVLGALKAIVQMYGPSSDYSHHAQAAWARCEAAIAKAEGQ